MITAEELLQAGEDAIDTWARSVAPRALVAIAARARVRFWSNPWRLGVKLTAPIDPALLPAFAPKRTVGAAALLSLHRSGYVREIALDVLARAPEPFVVPFLLLRADDIVDALAARAFAAVEARLRPEYTATFVRSLRIVELLRGRRRGGARVRRIREFLAGEPIASDDPDPLVRRLAFGLRLEREARALVLDRALADPDTAVRLWAARTAISRATTDDEKRALLPALEASRSAWTRCLALRARTRLDPSDAPLEAALLDPHAAPRHLARTLLNARHPARAPSATREAALAVLRPETGAARLTGALGALADVGRATDAEAVARFLGHPVARVRAEARRTARLLAG